MFSAKRLAAASLSLFALQACSDATAPAAGSAAAPRVERFGPLSASTVAAAGAPFSSSSAPVAPNGLPIDSATARVRTILPGATITAAVSDEERSLPTWKVKAQLASGARLEFELLQSNGLVVTIEGTTGPFDYDLTPGNGLVTFAAARTAALAAQAGTVVQWELELEEQNKWEYEFYVRDAQGALWEIELDAATGRVLERKAKRGSGRDSAGDQGDDDDDTLVVAMPDSIRQRLAALVGGARLKSVETERDNDVHVWEVEFESPNGKKIEVKALIPDGSLFEIEGDDEPTGITIVPGTGLRSFAQALEAARGAKNGAIDEWELSRTADNTFEWRFYIEATDGKWIVRVNASTGAVASARDDDDDDDDDDGDD